MTARARKRRFLHSPGRATLTLSDRTTLSAERLTEGADDEDLIYTWPTFMTAREFLGACTEYKHKGFFGLEVEVMVFHKSDSDSFGEQFEYESFLQGSSLDEGALAVRFNAHMPSDDFSVVWVPIGDLLVHEPRDRRVAIAELQATFGKTPNFMKSMISESITEGGRPYVNQFVAEGTELQPTLL